MRIRDAVLAGACVVLLAPAAALTLCRLSDPSWGRAVQAVAFTPLGLPLYAAALLLLAVVMVVRRTVAVPYALPAAIAAAGLVLHALWFAPQVTGDVPEPAAGAAPVVVMTVNVLRGHGDVVGLVAQARELDVDLLAVTEITTSSLAEMEDAGLTQLLPHREGRPGFDGDVSGTMVFSNEPTALVDVLDTRLGALVVDTAGLRLMAVHPMAPPWPDLWRSDHATILDAVEEREPDLVAGDFNATPDHTPMRALEAAGYRSSVEQTNGGWQPTWPVNGSFGLIGFLGPVAQIDHVLVSDDWAVTESHTIELGGTDHQPVIADVARR